MRMGHSDLHRGTGMAADREGLRAEGLVSIQTWAEMGNGWVGLKNLIISRNVFWPRLDAWNDPAEYNGIL